MLTKIYRPKNHTLNTPDLLHYKQVYILLADDDEDDRELLSEAMAASIPQAILKTAGNGKELMDILTQSDRLPDVLLLDLNMPIKGGQECLTEIRSNENLARLPVLVYSTSGNQDQIDDMYHLGADYYIRKPSSFSGLKEMAYLIGSMPWSGHQTPPREKFVLLKDLKNS